MLHFIQVRDLPGKLKSSSWNKASQADFLCLLAMEHLVVPVITADKSQRHING